MSPAVSAYSKDMPALLRDVLQSHPEIRASAASFAAATQDVTIAQQQFLPTPSFSLETAQAKAGDSLYSADKQVAVMRLQQPLWTGGRLSANLAKAEAAADLRKASLEEVRHQLAQTAVEHWGNWCAAEARLAVIANNVQLHRELRDKVERRVTEGASAPSELVMTDGRLAQVLSQQASQRSQRQLARARFSQLLGSQALSESCPDWPGKPTVSFAGLPQALDLALERHPMMARLLSNLRVTENEIKEKQGERWPEVFLRLEHQRGNFAISNTQPFNRIFVGMNSRLGPGLSTFQQIEAAVQRQLAAEQEMESGRRKTAEQVEALWIQWLDVQGRLTFLQDQVSATRSTQEAWERQFLAGRKAWLDVMNAARESMQAEIDLADARVNEKSLQWRLALMVQGVDEVLSVQR